MAAQTRQQRADDTRARLFQAASELFFSRGFSSTTVEQIAQRAGVAKGTFFVHFPSKDAIVRELVRVQGRTAREARLRRLDAGSSPLDALRATTLSLGKQAALSRNVSHAVLVASLESPEVSETATSVFDEVLNDLVADARRAKEQGLLEDDVEPESLARRLLVAYLGSALYYVSTPRAKPLLEVLRPLVEDVLAATARKQRGSGRKVTHHEAAPHDAGPRAPRPRVQRRRDAD